MIKLELGEEIAFVDKSNKCQGVATIVSIDKKFNHESEPHYWFTATSIRLDKEPKKRRGNKQ